LSGAGKDSAAIMSAVNSTAPTVGTEAAIESGSVITAGGDIAVTANENVEVDIIVGGAAAGFVGIGAGISVLNVAANATAHAAGTLSAGGDITVQAVLSEDVEVLGFAGAAGFVGLGAAVVVINDTSTAAAYIEAGSDIVSAPASLFLPTNTKYHRRDRPGSGRGGRGRASFVKINVGNDSVTDTSALIGSNVDIGQAEDNTVGNISVNAVSTISAHAEANGISAGIGAFSTNFALVDITSR